MYIILNAFLSDNTDFHSPVLLLDAILWPSSPQLVSLVSLAFLLTLFALLLSPSTFSEYVSKFHPANQQ